LRRAGKSVAVVPTMGALHAGHLALVDDAKARADAVVVSIFVNPTQFGPSEDFNKYPRPLDADLAACRERGVAVAFCPSVEEMYPPGEATRVRVQGLTDHLCGSSRPGHFEGVATVVTKLFGLTGRCVAIFGRKDYQQLKVVERLVRDLGLPVQVVGHPIVREIDGLALSSRNAYLSEDQRARALTIPRALSEAARRFEAGEHGCRAILEGVRTKLAAAELRLDYAVLADLEEVAPLPEDAQIPSRALLALATFAGATRLIDNLVLGEDPAPLP
jgi:pantoate--beta-alanine ligase